jgi:hypothetical protein
LPDEDAEKAARALAAKGGGSYQPVHRLADIAPALTAVLC